MGLQSRTRMSRVTEHACVHVRLFMGAWPEKSDGEEPGGLQSMGLQSRTRMSRVTEHACVHVRLFMGAWVFYLLAVVKEFKSASQDQG